MSMGQHKIIILTGNDSFKRLKDIHNPGTDVWIRYEDYQFDQIEVFSNVPYNTLAVYASRLRHPSLTAKELYITDLQCFKNNTTCERHPIPSDLNSYPHLMEQLSPKRIFISTLSRLYNQCLVEIGTYPPFTEKFGYPLAAEAITHMICDLQAAGLDIYLSAHETMIGDRIVPHLPKSVYEMCSLYVQCDNGIMTVMKSALPDVHEHQILGEI